ncbi:MAG: class I SAM-dependent DNA methyltransferase [Bacteroidales bacterium]|jgi:type I restriction enzyme M protein|nr:class I SAM-dependent DNA methyltransferase [Bacteroidales bacterium]
MAKKNGNGTEEPLEKQLWKAADKLRKNIDAAEYKHVVLGLIFLKYISYAFEELFAKLKAEEAQGADPEDKDEYKAENIFFVPQEARWKMLISKAKQPDIGKFVDDAMDAIERENASLKGVLPKVYARQNLDPTSLGELIDLVGNIALGDTKARSADVLGHVFEYFLGEFALAEGKKGGQFYTPRSVVELLVEMLEPYQGRVFDPCCGSGGMFVQSEKFVTEHQGKVIDISIYGQESNQTTWRLCKMNLAIRGIDSSQVKWNNEGSLLNNAHKDLKVDFIIANPPFNDGDWGGNLLRNDGRWKYGIPPETNANFAWIQHFIYHLGINGKAVFVLADTSLSTVSNDESKIRKELVQANLVDCIVSLPSHLFSNTQIAACVWFLSRERENLKNERKNQILFIDASSFGKLVTRKSKKLRQTEIESIAKAYHNWKVVDYTKYKDEAGFCKSVNIKVVEDNNYVLSPNRYIEPKEHAIELDISPDNENIASELSSFSDKIEELTNSIINDLDTSFKIGLINQINRLTETLTLYSKDLYKAFVKKYFIDFEGIEKEDLNSKWSEKQFGELFKERNTKVKNLGFCPPIYSLTNNGIISREGKYSKDLSKSNDNYKVAFEGDMVFGLSREIPNLDVLTVKQGAFSGAYHIFSPYDLRIGLIIGTIMRLKLMEQVDILKGGAREGRGLDKEKLLQKTFLVPNETELNRIWGELSEE